MSQPRRSRPQSPRRKDSTAARRSAGTPKGSSAPKGSAKKGTSAPKGSSARKGGRTRQTRKPDGRLRRVVGGDRPYMAGFVVLLVLVVTMALGPLQNFTAAADRVDSLESTRDQLRQQVDALEDRRTQLSDPEELELIARSELGLVMPGEVPFVVVSPTDDVEQVRPEPPTPEPVADGAWYRRLGRSLQDLFTTDP
jgi:cell division protein FtsB